MGCFSSKKDPTLHMLKHAEKTFNKIDKSKKKYLQASDLEKYFGVYSATATKIVLREMDSNKDGKVTRSEWMGYWEMVRRAGHRIPQIENELDNIDNGKLDLNFSQTKSYQSTQPRETVVQNIITEMRHTYPDLPFSLES